MSENATMTPEQAKAAYEAAKQVEANAKQAYDSIKASQEPTVKAYEAAKQTYDNLKPAMQLAKAQVQKAAADVTITFSIWKALAPKEAAEVVKKGPGNGALLASVVAVLTGKPDGLTNDEIFTGLQAAGVAMAGENPRDNLNAYLSRWGAVKAGGLVSAGTGKWKLESAVAAPPAFLNSAPSATEPDEDFPGLGEDFPGYEPLKAAGITTKDALVGKTKDELTAIAGIGAKTADKILEALAA